MEFKNFNLHPDLQKGIDEAGYVTCMPVQEQVLSHAFGGQDKHDSNAEHAHHASNDLYVQSQTGTGKTAAFLIVIFQRMLTEETLFKKKALIMAPTRELAVQIEEEAKILGKYLPFKTGSFFGGVGYAQQEKLLKENAQIMVGTPGRVLDLNKSGRMNLMDIAFLVLDEADRMFDMGFYPDLRKLIKVVPSVDRRQTMLFSATLNAYVKNLAWEYTKKPFEIDIKPEIVTVEEVTQILYHVPSEEKMPLLLGIINREQPESLIIFCNTKKSTEIVAKRLKINGYDCEFIIGDLPQSKRLKIIDDVKAGKTKTLVATDVAARGLDIESLAMVINYDLPVEAENYVHRIGRTARAGKTGKAITLSSEQDVYELPAIERYIGKKIPSEIAGQELYAQDKSAGQRIRTDFYEERHHSGARTHAGKRGEKRKPDEHRKGSNKHRRETAAHSPLPKGAPSVGITRKGAEKKRDHDLSNLSMEERMALYKKKYTSGEAKHGGNKEHGRQNAVKRHHSDHAHSATHSAAHGVTHSNVMRTNSPKTGQREEQKTQKQTAPAKKGILAKLKGLFKKK
ncbi:MAG: DEAD/DEAH box helicase [Treponema sp.]|jgi:ATP-dependent RNA helicase RhlB|nr:DEAD/DEAH box helicase [Treponema sp.]